MPVKRAPAPLPIRQRRVRHAMIGLAATAVASLAGVFAVYGVSKRPGIDSTDIERGLAVTGAMTTASLLSLAGTGIGLGVLAREERDGWPEGDPRRDPGWAWKDRALMRHLAFWSTLLGASVVGLSVCGGLLAGDGEDETGPAVCALSFAAFTGAFALPTIGVAVGRWHHRTPLRRYELELRGTGLQVRF